MSRFIIVSAALAALTACSDTFATQTPPSPPAFPPPIESPASTSPAHTFWETNASVHWDSVARSYVATNNSNALVAIRGYMMVTVAQYNAAIAAEKAQAGSTHPSVRAAIAAASVVTLSYLYPAHTGTLETSLDQFLAAEGSPGDAHEDLASGEAIGRGVGAQLVARGMTDGFFAPFTGTIPTGPGIWYGAPGAPLGGPMVGQAKPFFLLSGSQFRPPPPPAFGSPEFLSALAEVRAISDARTPAQVQNAQFWNAPAGTHQPPGIWNEEASRLAVKYRLTQRETAHVLALMNIVAYDVIIASHEAKYYYWLIRPSQVDPGITLPIGLPNFPSYPSNHAAISAGMARILGNAFPAEKARLDAWAEEAALSRIWGGIHYRFDGEAGLELGRKIAAWALQHDIVGHNPLVVN